MIGVVKEKHIFSIGPLKITMYIFKYAHLSPIPLARQVPWYACVLIALCTPTISAAAYSETDTAIGSATLSYLWDDNLFRLGDGVLPTAPLGKMDRTDLIRDTTAGLKLSTTLSKQLLTADLNVSDVSFKNHSDFDYIGWNGAIAWQWAINDQLLGKVSYSDRRKISDFEDTQQLSRDLLRQQISKAELEVKLRPEWSLLMDGQLRNSDHDTLNDLDLKETQWGASLRYSSPTGSQWQFSSRYQQADYRNESPSDPLEQRGFYDWTNQLAMRWDISPKAEVELAYGLARWQLHHTDEVRIDPIGLARLTWRPTVKTAVMTHFVRSFTDPALSMGRQIEETFRLELASKSSYQFKWTLSTEQVKKRTSGPLAIPTHYYRAELQYQPRSALDFGVYIEKQRRNADLAADSLSVLLLGINANLRF